MFFKTNRKIILNCLLLALTAIMVLCTSYFYLRKTASFRFFDEENNIVAGYLMTTGRDLYTDIFMNHNPLPIVLSAVIQKLFVINTLFELVKYHRLFMIVFALVANILLFVRFRFKSLIFICVYEFIKFYLSGQMFLAEGMIGYMFAYLVLLIITSLSLRLKIQKMDVLIASLCVSFIVLSREPYIPVAFALYMIVFYLSKSKKWFVVCAILSISIIIGVMIQFNLGEFYKQVVLLNREMAKDEFKVQNGMQIFSGLTQLYQYVFVGLKLDKPVYIVLGLVNIVLLYLSVKNIRRVRLPYRMIVLVTALIILFLAGVRNYQAGAEWYGMYRSIPYIAIILASVSALALNRTTLFIIICTYLVAFIHPRSHILEQKTNTLEYYINYSQTNQFGSVINSLCSNYPYSCSLHVDDIFVYTYWLTKKPLTYKYAFYYGVNQAYLDYKEIRRKELIYDPPTIYLDANCNVAPVKLPVEIESDYRYLTEIDLLTNKRRQSCIAVRKELLPYIDDKINAELLNNQVLINK